MNRYTLLLTFLLSLFSFPSLGVDFKDLVERDGLVYEEFTDVPYTGKGTRYHDNGQLSSKGNYKNGKKI